MVVTEGLNPHFTSDERFLAACSTVRHHYPLPTTHYPLFFYGSGCGSADQRARVVSLLSKAFGTSDIHVETDMLGACRAVRGDKAGMVGILGTGSNACYYDGEKIVCQPFSMGYILGDEGSANHVGRQLLQDYLSDKMGSMLSARFHDDYPMTKAEFMDAVYHQPNANRFLASLAPFALKYAEDKSYGDYLSSLILYCLDCWFTHQLGDLYWRYGCRWLSLVGGFAARIPEAVLQQFADIHGLSIDTVLADPIDGLREYHTAN